MVPNIYIYIHTCMSGCEVSMHMRASRHVQAEINEMRRAAGSAEGSNQIESKRLSSDSNEGREAAKRAEANNAPGSLKRRGQQG